MAKNVSSDFRIRHCSHVGNKAFPRWECSSSLKVVNKQRLSINKEALLQNKGLLLQHKGALLLQ